jgi:hypothetical protein
MCNTSIHVYSTKDNYDHMKLMKIILLCVTNYRGILKYTKVLQTQVHTVCSDIRESYGMRKVDL